MGYFKGLAAGSFKRDGDGNTVFFPYGIFARGRVLLDEGMEQRARTFVTRYNAVGLLGGIGIVLLTKWLWLVVFLPLMLAWYYYGVRSLVGSRPYSGAKLTLGDSFASSAAAHNVVTLWFLFASSVLFVVGGVFMAIDSEAMGDKAMGVAGVIFFGMAAAAIAYMLKARRSSTSSQSQI